MNRKWILFLCIGLVLLVSALSARATGEPGFLVLLPGQ